MTNEIKKADYKILGVMPVIGLGTWEMAGSGCIDSVIKALELGYRHIDTAQIYGNEKEVGKGMQQSGVNRDEVFLTTKIATSNLTPGRIKRTTEESLEKLATSYVDLLLIHWPTETMNLSECLETMFELKDQGVVKYVGVSNFNTSLFKEAIAIGPVLTNQVKFTPYHGEFENLKFAQEQKKIITAYSPLARGRIVTDRILNKIGEKYGKSASQIALRWLIQLENVSVIPKASSEQHLKENLEILDFEISVEDMDVIKQMSRKLVWNI